MDILAVVGVVGWMVVWCNVLYVGFFVNKNTAWSVIECRGFK